MGDKIRWNFFIEKKLLESIKKVSESKGVKLSSYIRQVLRDHMDNLENAENVKAEIKEQLRLDIKNSILQDKSFMDEMKSKLLDLKVRKKTRKTGK